MYRDLRNVEVWESQTTLPSSEKNLINLTKNYSVLKLGIGNDNWNNDIQGNFDKICYGQAGLFLNIKWDCCHLERDMELESQYFEKYQKKYNITEGKYIFVHDEGTHPNNKIIDKKYFINKNYTVVRPGSEKYNIFGFIYLIENAAEIHVLNSSFFNLIELFVTTKAKLFYHIHASGYGDTISTKKPWIRIA